MSSLDNELNVHFIDVKETVFPSKQQTIDVEEDENYGGAHHYRIRNCLGFDPEKNDTIYESETQSIQFVQKNDDGTIIPGLQSEQLAIVMLDRCKKLDARFPSDWNKKQIEGLEMFLTACKGRVEERMARGVMGELKK